MDHILYKDHGATPWAIGDYNGLVQAAHSALLAKVAGNTGASITEPAAFLVVCLTLSRDWKDIGAASAAPTPKLSRHHLRSVMLPHWRSDLENQSTGLFIAVCEEDAKAPEVADFPVPMAILSVVDDEPVLQGENGPIPAEVAYAGLLGAVALGPDAHKGIKAFGMAWSDRYGTALPRMLDLTEAAGGKDDQITQWVLEALVEGRVELARRNVRLQRDLAQLRLTHDQTQSAFQQLEGFVYSRGGPERSMAFELRALQQRAPITLQPNDWVAQRLPVSSTGLSDVAIWVTELPEDSSGRLEASLELVESGESVGQWSLDAEALNEGWLRLSLANSLGTDRQTPSIRVRWTGSTPLKLGQTMQHPDDRFHAIHNGATHPRSLATAGWSCVAGTALPLPSGAHCDAPIIPRRWIIPAETIQSAKHDGETGKVAYSEELGGLIVAPAADGTCVARMINAAHPGMAHFTCSIETKSESGPEVEYAVALTEPGADPEDTGQSLCSDWLALPPSQWSELHLLLSDPVRESRDICLLTRIAGSSEGAPQNPADLRCCFFEVRATA